MPRNARTKAPHQLTPEREQELVEAARAVFVEVGLGRATTDMIAAKARVSKTTIYRRYKNKEALFEAVVRQAAEKMAAELSSIELDPDQPEKSLRHIALAIRDANDAELCEIIRLMISEAPRLPKLCRDARAVMFAASTGRLIDYFEELARRGQMEHPYPKQAAATFGLVFARGFRPLFNALESDAEEQRRFEADMALFLHGCRIRGPRSK